MFDFVKFARDHPDISVNIEYWRHSPRGIIITLEKLQPTVRRWRFCLDEELYTENLHYLDDDKYIEMWLNQGLRELDKKIMNGRSQFLWERFRKEDTNDQN